MAGRGEGEWVREGGDMLLSIEKEWGRESLSDSDKSLAAVPMASSERRVQLHPLWLYPWREENTVQCSP